MTQRAKLGSHQASDLGCGEFLKDLSVLLDTFLAETDVTVGGDGHKRWISKSGTVLSAFGYAFEELKNVHLTPLEKVVAVMNLACVSEEYSFQKQCADLFNQHAVLLEGLGKASKKHS